MAIGSNVAVEQARIGMNTGIANEDILRRKSVAINQRIFAGTLTVARLTRGKGVARKRIATLEAIAMRRATWVRNT
jgi:hypothetical protein